MQSDTAMYSREAAAIAASGDGVAAMEQIGRSREGRPIRACRIGDGPLRVSLLGGCHADEPVGPRFLDCLARYLSSPAGAELRRIATWHIVPHLNPDGAVRNAQWQRPGATRYDFVSYLRHRVRELPGDDVEFGFPAGLGGGGRTDPGAGADAGGPTRGSPASEAGARPENLAAAAFWSEAGPFDLHASLHGMSVAAGPYFLLERSWWPRFGEMARFLAGEVRGAGYVLHDVERHGEKGFHRLAPGFCSRPDSRAMKRHFLDRGEPDVAARFRPSSMEAIRALGADPLTLVSEMPLFVLPGVGETLGPPDPALVRWGERIAEWDARIQRAAAGLVRAREAGIEGAALVRDAGLEGASTGGAASGDREADREGAREVRCEADEVRREADEAGLAPMPVAHQMRFQWAFIRAGLAVVRRERA